LNDTNFELKTSCIAITIPFLHRDSIRMCGSILLATILVWWQLGLNLQSIVKYRMNEEHQKP
jgi:hypothetical protein